MMKIAAALFAQLFRLRAGARQRDIALIDKIVNEFRDIYKKETVGKNEISDAHAQFRFYFDSVDSETSEHCSPKDRDRIRHALLAARVLCWTLRFENYPDAEIGKIMDDRVKAILTQGAYHSSYERFMVELTKAGWSDYRADFDHSVMKVREWCRANIDEIIRLRTEMLQSVRFLEDLYNLYASTAA